MEPVDWSTRRGSDGIGDLHEVRGIARFFEMMVTIVAVAEMEAELDAGRNALGDAGEPLDDCGFHVREMHRPEALPDRHFDRDVPLQRQRSMRNRGADLIYFGQEAR